MSEKVSGFLKDYWQIIVAIVLAAAAWGTSTAQMKAIGDGQVQIATDVRTILQAQAGMQVARQFNEASIAELKERVLVLERRR